MLSSTQFMLARAEILNCRFLTTLKPLLLDGVVNGDKDGGF
jgi:hypothetical protein